jgi:hypothetical protein
MSTELAPTLGTKTKTADEQIMQITRKESALVIAELSSHTFLPFQCCGNLCLVNHFNDTCPLPLGRRIRRLSHMP